MKKIMFALFVCASIGCGPPVPWDAFPCQQGYTHQCEAEALVWNQIMEEPGHPPLVEWVDGEVCKVNSAFHCVPGYNALGKYWAGFDVTPWIEIAREPRAPDKIWASAYVHELMHAHLDNKYNDSDGDHVRAEWGTYKDGNWSHINEINWQILAEIESK